MKGLDVEVSPVESLTYNYWFIIIQLLKMGFSWEAVHELTTVDVSIILGIQGAITETEQEQSAKKEARMMSNIPRM